MGNLPFSSKKVDPELYQLLEEKIKDAVERHHLRCHNLQLKTLPDILFSQPQFTESLKSVDFSGNNLEYFPQINLPKVTDTNLWGNNMTDQMFAPFTNDKKQKNKSTKKKDSVEQKEINEEVHLKLGSFSLMPLLENLDLGHNHLSQIPLSLSFLKSLDQIHLMGNLLTDSNKSLSALNNLEKISYLDLNFNRLRTIPKNCTTNKPRLLTLLMQGNRITAIPSHLSDVSTLQKLNLADNFVDTVEDGAFDNLTSLKTIFLQNNFIQMFPDDCFKSLECLTQLIMSNNQLISLPSSITSLSSLRLLNLSDNNITELPSNLRGLNNLTELNLSNNNISYLPLTIAFLTELRTLNLSYNNISALPITFAYLTNLSTLSLRGNNISNAGDTNPISLPSFLSEEFFSFIDDEAIGSNENSDSNNGISQSKRKKKKNRNQNSIKGNISIGVKVIWELTMMEELDLSFNALTHLPENAFLKLDKLTKICLSYNHLQNETLPILFHEQEGRVCMIECVCLNGNFLREFPSLQLESLHLSLRKLSIDENPISMIPPSIADFKQLNQLVVSVPLKHIDSGSNHDENKNTSEAGDGNGQHSEKKNKARNSDDDGNEDDSNDSSNEIERSKEEKKENIGSASCFLPKEIHNVNLKRLLVGNYYNGSLEEIGHDLASLKLQGSDLLHHQSYPSFSSTVEKIGVLESHPCGFAVTKGTSSHPIEDCIAFHTITFHFQDGDITTQYVGVFDGHGGNDVSLFVQSKLHHYFNERIQLFKENPFIANERSLSSLYKVFYELFEDSNNDLHDWLIKEGKMETPMGSTAVVVLFTDDLLFCINAGDSRAVLASSSSLQLLPYPNMNTAQPMPEQSPKKISLRSSSQANNSKNNNNSNNNNNNNNNSYDDNQIEVLVDNDKNPIKISSSASHRIISNEELGALSELLNHNTSHLSKNLKTLRLSVDHKPHLHVEVEKIRSRKAFVMPDASGLKGARLGIASGPAVAVSRAFGDFYLGSGITNQPHILAYKLDHNNDLFLILGSDGVWDVISDSHATQFALKIFHQYISIIHNANLICGIVASRLRDLVLSLGSGDDISVAVVPLGNFAKILENGGPLPKPSCSSKSSPTIKPTLKRQKKKKKQRSQSNLNHLKRENTDRKNTLQNSLNF